MAHTRTVAAELLSTPPPTAGTGTVTEVDTTDPILGGPIVGVGAIGIRTFDATHRGAVPASGGGTVNYLRADGTFADPAGTGSDAVSLQTTTPGTADTGNYNISGTGIVGKLFVGPLASGGDAVSFYGDLNGNRIVNVVGGPTNSGVYGIQMDMTAGAGGNNAINAVSDGAAIYGQSSDDSGIVGVTTEDDFVDGYGGVRGNANSGAAGVFGQSGGTGMGVLGLNAAQVPVAPATALIPNNVGLAGVSQAGPSGYFVTSDPTNTSPTVIVQQQKAVPNTQTSDLTQWLDFGGGVIAKIAVGGDAAFGGKLAVGSATIGSHQLDVTGTGAFTGALTAANFAGILSGVTGSIGGGLLTVGMTASGTAAVTGAIVGRPVSVSASDGTLPNPLTVLSAAVTATDVVTVQLAAIATVTPTSKTYNVRVVL